MQVCKYASMQVCKYASMQAYADMQTYKYASMKLYTCSDIFAQAHMVKCHENAYLPKNLSLFAFSIEGY